MRTTLDIQEAALKYTDLGLAIIPLCPPDHKGMGTKHIESCNAPGKAPVINNWQYRGVPREEEVEEWFRRNPNYNIGLILGDTGEYNLVGIDIDGEIGEELLEDSSRGVLPPTWEFRTGNGRRLIYSLPDGAESKKKAFKGEGGELAFLAQGQQTVLPPSTHISGSTYEWTSSPTDSELADAPQWLLNSILLVLSTDDVPEKTVTVEDWQEKITEGNRNNHMTKLAGSLIARRNIPKTQVLAFLNKWNEDNCEPPLPEQEIVTAVENLWEVEHAKAGRMKKQKGSGDKLLPTPFSETFLERQKKKGILWRYCSTRGLFYRCDSTVGPWQSVDEVYLTKAIRSELIESDPSWDSQRHIKEVQLALKDTMADPEMDYLFDMGINGDTDHIYLENGVLDWRTLELKQWDPSTFSTIKLPVRWDSDIVNSDEYEYWENVLAQWLPDEGSREFLQEFLGYCLIPDTGHRTAVFLFGGGSNGKSLFLDVISKLFEQYITFVPLHFLSERFETTQLLDKLINVCGDIDSKFMSETGMIKSIISGDPIRAEYKFGKSFHFTPVCRLIFSANRLPRTSDHSEGWYSRWKFIEFPRRFKTNTSFKRNLLERMSHPNALSALLYWGVQGLRRLYQIEEFTVGQSMEMAEEMYRLESDTVNAFVSQCISYVAQTGEKTVLVSSSLYKVYRVWCEDNGLRPVSQHEFVRRMGGLDIDKGVRRVKGASANVFLGAGFNQFAEQEGYVEEYMFTESIRASTIKRKAQRTGGSFS